MNDYENKIIHADVIEGLKQIPDESVSLVFSSPPYNVRISYGGNHDDDMPYADYLNWLRGVWIECKRVLKPGGRLIINIDAPTNRQEDREQEYLRPIYADLINMMKDIGGLLFKTEIMWYKQNVAGRKTAWGCFDEQTRVVTKSGIKRWIDVTEDDYFLTLNLSTRDVEYQKPLGLVKRPYKGAMYRLKNKTTDLLVTPNHNMIVEDYRQRLKLREMQNCPKSFRMPKHHNGLKFTNEDVEKFEIPTCSYGKRTNPAYIENESFSVLMDDWLRFLGIWFTDGNVDYSKDRGYYKVSIYQSKPKFLSEVKSLLDRLPWFFRYKASKTEWYVCNKRLAAFLYQFGDKINRQVPSFIYDLSPRQKRIFIDWLFIGDGHKSDKCNGYLAIASRAFVDGIVPLFYECGLFVSISRKSEKSMTTQNQKNRLLNGKVVNCNHRLWLINILSSKNYYIEKEYIDKIDYDGMIYCAEVPNHALLVERNGKMAWSGNSYCLPSNPNIRRLHEYVLVWCKDQFKLEGDSNLADITDEEFQQWTTSMWFISPETRNLGGHPVPFPEELVKRVIKLFTYRENLVLDPFSGSGTTCAVAKKLGRRYVGIDNNLDFVQYSKDRLRSVASADMFAVDRDSLMVRRNRLKKEAGKRVIETDIFK